MSSNELYRDDRLVDRIRTRYKWVSVYHWLEERILNQRNTNLTFRNDVMSILRTVDAADAIQDHFESALIDDGYYDEYVEDISTGLLYECPECGKHVLFEEAGRCHNCKKIYHWDSSCLDINDDIQDPICYYCSETKYLVDPCPNCGKPIKVGDELPCSGLHCGSFFHSNCVIECWPKDGSKEPFYLCPEHEDEQY